eukprot:Trichotokara_eunicae@DN10563_c0_g1_i1.p2
MKQKEIKKRSSMSPDGKKPKRTSSPHPKLIGVTCLGPTMRVRLKSLSSQIPESVAYVVWATKDQDWSTKWSGDWVAPSSEDIAVFGGRRHVPYGRRAGRSGSRTEMASHEYRNF